MIMIEHLCNALPKWMYSNVLYNTVCGSDADIMDGYCQGSLRP